MEAKKFYDDVISFYWRGIPKLQYSGSDPVMKGCFFRPYWEGRSDFANARWQEAVLTLAWLSARGEPGLQAVINDGIDFWCSAQNRDGSFSECCRGERAFSATAFSTSAVCGAMKLTGSREEWLSHVRSAARWLERNDELVLINQEAAAALALLQAGKLLKEDRFIHSAGKKMERVLHSQSAEGFYSEKGGCDTGYSSLTLEMLMRFNTISPSEALTSSAEKFARFFAESGCRKESRTTSWVISGGFEMLAASSPNARECLRRIFEKREKDFVHIADERHLCTDLYRHCLALDAHASSGCKLNVGAVRLRSPVVSKPDPSGMKILRRLGTHRFRGLKFRVSGK